jgi:hypothetical protein
LLLRRPVEAAHAADLGDVEADDACRLHGAGGNLGMDGPRRSQGPLPGDQQAPARLGRRGLTVRGGAGRAVGPRGRHAHRLQQGARQGAVAGDRLGQGAGPVGLPGQEALLVHALSQEQQPFGGEPGGGKVGLPGRLEKGGGAGVWAGSLRQPTEPFDLAGDVKGLVVDGRQTEAACGLQASPPQFLLLVLDHDPAGALGGRFTGPAKAHLRAGLALQFQGHVFQGVAGAGAFLQPLQETAPPADAAAMLDQRRQPAHQPGVEARQLVRACVPERPKIDPGLQDRETGPDVRAAQRQHSRELHRVLLGFR